MDVHDRGIKIIGRALRDAGMEVIYLGPSQLPTDIVRAAIEEDVDVIGISSMEGMHLVRLPEVTQLLRERGVEDILVVAGGIIPDEDRSTLKKAGIAEIFGPGTLLRDITNFIMRNVRK